MIQMAAWEDAGDDGGEWLVVQPIILHKQARASIAPKQASIELSPAALAAARAAVANAATGVSPGGCPGGTVTAAAAEPSRRSRSRLSASSLPPLKEEQEECGDASSSGLSADDSPRTPAASESECRDRGDTVDSDHQLRASHAVWASAFGGAAAGRAPTSSSYMDADGFGIVPDNDEDGEDWSPLGSGSRGSMDISARSSLECGMQRMSLDGLSRPGLVQTDRR